MMSRPAFYSSYNENAMLVAVIFLLAITILMLLLHFYAKWRFQRRRRGIVDPPSSTTTAAVREHPFSPVDVDRVGDQGLDPSLLASLPVFVYKSKIRSGLLCVVCLSVMEEEEKGRMLPKCGHCFHVGCIDKWLLSHSSSCPICRSTVGTDEALAFTSSSATIAMRLQHQDEQDGGRSEMPTLEHHYSRTTESNHLHEYCLRIRDQVVPPGDTSSSSMELQDRRGIAFTAASSSLSCSLKLMLSGERFASRVHSSLGLDGLEMS